MSQKIDIRCNHCGHLLFKKIIPERKGEREYGGIEIPCPNCKTMNTVGVKPPTSQGFGERLTYNKKSA